MLYDIKTDTLTNHGAERLAKAIEVFWARKGFAVRTWVEAVIKPVGKRVPVENLSEPKNEIIYCVRSDMVGGLPRPA